MCMALGALATRVPHTTHCCRQAARADQLVDTYECSCARHGLHVDAGVVKALARSVRSSSSQHGSGRPQPGCSLELVSLTLVNELSAQALAEVLPHCTHINGAAQQRTHAPAQGGGHPNASMIPAYSNAVDLWVV